MGLVSKPASFILLLRQQEEMNRHKPLHLFCHSEKQLLKYLCLSRKRRISGIPSFCQVRAKKYTAISLKWWFLTFVCCFNIASHILFSVVIKYVKFFVIYWNTLVCLIHLFQQRTENISTVFFLISEFNSEHFCLPEKARENKAIPYISGCLLYWRNDFCKFSLLISVQDWPMLSGLRGFLAIYYIKKFGGFFFLEMLF